MQLGSFGLGGAEGRAIVAGRRSLISLRRTLRLELSGGSVKVRAALDSNCDAIESLQAARNRDP